jgi:ferritin-like metal-binding protein YciE
MKKCSEKKVSRYGKVLIQMTTDLLIAWLNDAHGMENALIQILEHQIKDAKDSP